MDNYTVSEQECLQLIQHVRSLKEEGNGISTIARLLGKDRRTIKRYLNGDPEQICKHTRQRREDPFEKRIITLVSQGYIQKQVIETIFSEGYDKSYSAARHLVNRVIQRNHMEVNKYCSCIRNNKVKDDTKNKKEKCMNRSYVFQHIWMNAELSRSDITQLIQKYPVVTLIIKIVQEFREIYQRKSLTLLYLFIEKYIKCNIPEIASFAKGLVRDIEAVENSVSSDLSNGFVEGMNSKLKMLKRTMYGRCRKELLAAKMML